MFSIAGFAQTNRQYIFLHLGTHDGVLSNETQAAAQDAKGYIWIGSKNGLQRYDGNRFVDFKHTDGDSNSLPHNFITQLVMDKKNRLWIVTANNKLGYFDVQRFVFHEVRVKLNNQPVNKIEALLKLDLQKNILLIVYKEETANNVLLYDEQKHVFAETGQHFKLPVDWSVKNFSIDSLQHNYWIATNKGLMKYNTRTGGYSYRGHNEDNDAVINALQEYTLIENTLSDYEGNFWMNTLNTDRKSPNLFKYDAGEKKVYDYSKEINKKSRNAFNDVRSILQPQKGPVWITGRGLFVLGGDKLDFINSNMPGQYAIHYYEIRNVTFDRENNCWICTDNGIFRMNTLNTGFRYIDNKKYNDDSIYTSDVVDFLHLPNGHILTASWGSGLFEYDSNFNPVKSEIVKQSGDKQEKLIWVLHRRSNGDIWRGNQQGNLFIYHAQSNTTEKIHDPVFENKSIRQIAEDRNGNIWLGTQEALVKWDHSTNIFKLIIKPGIAVFRLYADKKGDIWALTDEAIRFDADNNAITARYKTGDIDGKHLRPNDIYDILQYNDSMYIIATEGLNFVNVKTGDIKYFTSANGLPTDYISNIILDKQNTLWMFTENGVCNRNFKEHRLSVYNIEDGISNSAFTPTSSTLLNDGRIAVGTIYNILVFDPSKIDNYGFSKAAVEITGISIMNKAVNTDSLLGLGSARLRYTQNSMTIQFSTLSYRNNYGVVYKLEGLDKKWINNNGRYEAVYSYLPPGNYTFKTGIDTIGGIKSFNAFRFTIATPFYKTWLFYSAIALLAAFILWRINRERIKRIKDVLVMRSNIGKDLHSEVSNTLKSISVLSEIAAMKADVSPEESKDYIHEIKLKSRSTVVAMDDVMWSIDPANDSMIQIKERMHEIADAVHHEYNANIAIDINSKAQHIDLSMKQRLEFMLIYKKALLLLAANTNAKQISITLDLKKADLLLELAADNKVNNRTGEKMEKELEEIKIRAAAMHYETDLQAGDTFTAFTLIIKHR